MIRRKKITFQASGIADKDLDLNEFSMFGGKKEKKMLYVLSIVKESVRFFLI